ncbi:hypothetical protein PIROE2DRAFT_10693 [Piromyces sp. E2]|nr:hypothetical protein PIROE2DRAFT_10693 [Piromyces sp. E2]|eukprot:OUM62892.1 hypothetical protein PIROE2DRAFT_10693 [Piromyces sp. E2]
MKKTIFFICFIACVILNLVNGLPTPVRKNKTLPSIIPDPAQDYNKYALKMVNYINKMPIIGKKPSKEVYHFDFEFDEKDSETMEFLNNHKINSVTFNAFPFDNYKNYNDVRIEFINKDTNEVVYRDYIVKTYVVY